MTGHKQKTLVGPGKIGLIVPLCPVCALIGAQSKVFDFQVVALYIIYIVPLFIYFNNTHGHMILRCFTLYGGAQSRLSPISLGATYVFCLCPAGAQTGHNQDLGHKQK